MSIPQSQPLAPVEARYRSRISAAAGCAALASLLDITADLSSAGVKLVVSVLSLAGLTIAGWAWLDLATAMRSAWAGFAGIVAESALARGWQQVLSVPEPPLATGGVTRGTRARFWLAYVPALEASYQETLARYGYRAALTSLRSRKAAFASRAIGCAVTAFWLAYVNLYFAFRTWPGLLVFLLAAGAAESASLAYGALSRREEVHYLQAMTEATGVDDLTASTAPWRPSQYATWCRTHDLEPYPFGRPELSQGDRAIV